MKMLVFFSWQNETNCLGFNNKKLIFESICKACKEIELKGQLKDITFEVQEGMRYRSGSEIVEQALKEQINQCDIFVGDITVGSHLNKIRAILKRFFPNRYRQAPNTNVTQEIGFSLNKYSEFDKQVILLYNQFNGDPQEDNSLIPFDLRAHRFPITFYMDKKSDAEEVKKRLANALKDPIRAAALTAKKNFFHHFRPFVPRETQKINFPFWGKYIPIDGFDSERKKVLHNKDIMRVIGLSGIGKTRFVMECFNDSELIDNYMYCDCGAHEISSLKNVLDDIFTHYKEAVVVLDDCNLEMLEFLVSRKRAGTCFNSVITIYNNLEERLIADVNYIKLQSKYENVVSELLNPLGNLSDEQKYLIERFADGIPMMAELLVLGLKCGRDLGDLGEEGLLSRLLGVSIESNERTFLKSLSLFSFLGWEKDRRNELCCIARSKNITSVNIDNDTVLLNSFDEAIRKFIKKSVIEQKGRTVGIRPMPLAIYLAMEWLDNCTDERILNAINDIQQAPCKRELIQAFHERFRYMNFCGRACEMLDRILGEESPFANAEVINTELGSHLFRTFVEVNPNAVALLFKRVFSSQSLADVKKIVEGRRNIVRVLEKLCFCEETFEIGASLMLQFANAENETWSNNATGQFTRLFSIHLPATCVSLERRYLFLKENNQHLWNKELILKALSVALSSNHFVYYCGAEEFGTQKKDNYEPKSQGEIVEYVRACLELVVSEIKNDFGFRLQAEKIIVNSVAVLCRLGMSNEILSIVEEISKIKSYDWDEMYEKLKDCKTYACYGMNGESVKEYERLEEKLTKKDFVSRFLNTEKEVLHCSREMQYDQIRESREKAYRMLAEEFFSTNLYSKKMMNRLMLAKVINVHPFGEVIAKRMSKTQCLMFVQECVDVLNSVKDADFSILVDFVTSLDDYLFKESLKIIRNTNDLKVLFVVFGRKGIDFEDDLFSELKGYVSFNKCPVSYFELFWNNSILDNWNSAKIISFFEIVDSFSNGFISLMKIYNTYLLFSPKNINYDVASKMLEMMVTRLDEKNFFDIELVSHNISVVLNLYDEKKYIKAIHEKLMDYVCTCKDVRSHYEIFELYRILVLKYFEYIWCDLSRKLLECNDIEFYNFTELLGSVMSESENLYGVDLFNESHMPSFLQWCEKYPEKAPICLIKMMPIIKNIDGKQEFTELVKEIISRYGDRKELLYALSLKLGSYVWSGSLVSFYEERKNALENLLEVPIEEVKKWVKKEIDCYDYKRKKAKEQEDEMQRF